MIIILAISTIYQMSFQILIFSFLHIVEVMYVCMYTYASECIMAQANRDTV